MKLPGRNQVLCALLLAAALLAILPEAATLPLRRQMMPVAGLLRNAASATLIALRESLPEPPELHPDSPDENTARLQHEIIALEAKLQALNQSMSELAMTQSLLDEDARQFQPLPARILIRNDLAQIAQTLVLNVGESQGVTANMPVVRGTSVVGVVESAGPGTCTVRMLTDARFRAAALGMDTRVQGVLAGTGTRSLKLRFVSIDTPLHEAEVVLTSGLDNIFPAGFLLGAVRSLSDPDQNKELDFDIEPALKFSDLETVVVLRPAQ